MWTHSPWWTLIYLLVICCTTYTCVAAVCRCISYSNLSAYVIKRRLQKRMDRQQPWLNLMALLDSATQAKVWAKGRKP